MGIVLDFHGWRGFSWDRDLFHWRVTAAFITLMLCKFCVTDRMKTIAEALTELKTRLAGGGEGR